MPIDAYLYYMREAVIYNNMQTSEGREYLEKCYNLECTKPDRNNLKQKFGGDK